MASPHSDRMKDSSALRSEARMMLLQKGIAEPDHEHFLLGEAELETYGNSSYVLSNVVAHVTNHSVREIVETCLTFTDIINESEPPMLSDEHITVCQQLTETKDDLLIFGKVQSHDDITIEFKKIMEYAMMNLEDGKLIAYMYEEREIHTLHEMLGLLPVLKANTNISLMEGVL